CSSSAARSAGGLVRKLARRPAEAVSATPLPVAVVPTVFAVRPCAVAVRPAAAPAAFFPLPAGARTAAGDGVFLASANGLQASAASPFFHVVSASDTVPEGCRNWCSMAIKLDGTRPYCHLVALRLGRSQRASVLVPNSGTSL